ncbi:MAG: aldo/keto reductase [Candidatus Kariarchaeaceae archaeon]|jgi:aryl-alcohol dehydrogenase-like predicted oxidoreductase
MKFRKLGKHGLKISEISLGTMYYGSYVKKEQGVKCLHEAVNSGINFIDSADRYGIRDSELSEEQRMRAEIVVGDFLKDHDRDDLVISSKIHHQLRDSPNSGGLSRKHIREGIQKTLNSLGTDYLDIYFCHRQDPDTPLIETIRTMTNLVDEGLVNYWGTSWYPPWKFQKIIGIAEKNGYIPPAVDQPPYHLGARYIEADLIPHAREEGFGITSFEALNSGIFTGKYTDGVPEGSRGSWSEQIANVVKTNYSEKLEKLDELCKEIDIKMNHLALAWSLRHPEISSSITGATKPEQVADNAKASGIELDQETIEKIDEIMDNKPRDFYR